MSSQYSNISIEHEEQIFDLFRSIVSNITPRTECYIITTKCGKRCDIIVRCYAKIDQGVEKMMYFIGVTFIFERATFQHKDIIEDTNYTSKLAVLFKPLFENERPRNKSKDKNNCSNSNSDDWDSSSEKSDGGRGGRGGRGRGGRGRGK